MFDSVESYRQAADDDGLDVTPDDILLLRNAGPRGYPGMPEVGNLPLPRRMLAAGVTDMVRISDARMSGTAYGTVVLHTAPEAAVGGPIALVRTGDVISLDVPARTLHLEVDDAELERRRAAWSPPPQHASRGWVRLYTEHVLQADQGCDLDFLVGSSGVGHPAAQSLTTGPLTTAAGSPGRACRAFRTNNGNICRVTSIVGLASHPCRIWAASWGLNRRSCASHVDIVGQLRLQAFRGWRPRASPAVAQLRGEAHARA